MKKSKKKSSPLPNHYASIDYLPVLNWYKVHETRDYSYLLEHRVAINEEQMEKLRLLWETLFDEFIGIFGWGDEFMIILRRRIEIGKLKLKKLITKDMSYQTLIDVAEFKLSLLMKNAGGGDIYTAKTAIERKLHVRVPLHECTVREFYSYIREIRKQ